MKLAEIHFHDCRIRRVIESSELDELHIEVDYPIDWDRNQFEPRVIVFREVLNYHVDEIAFHGAPTILDAVDKGPIGHRRDITLQTNAGTRSFLAAAVVLRQLDSTNAAMSD